MPHYLPKEGYFMLIILQNRVKDGLFNLPMSLAFKKEFGDVCIPFPKRLIGKNLREVRIIPLSTVR